VTVAEIGWKKKTFSRSALGALLWNFNQIKSGKCPQTSGLRSRIAILDGNNPQRENGQSSDLTKTIMLQTAAAKSSQAGGTLKKEGGRLKFGSNTHSIRIRGEGNFLGGGF